MQIHYHFQALKDFKYGIVYANLCKVMSTVNVTVEPLIGDEKPKIITFRRVLLTKVQQEFESKESDKEIRSMLNAIKETHDVSFITTCITVCIIIDSFIACQKEAT